MKRTLHFITTAISIAILTGCAGEKKEEDSSSLVKTVIDTLINTPENLPKTGINVQNDPNDEEIKLKAFLMSPEGTCGWETKNDKITFDFLKDGNLNIQKSKGKGGEWDGTWKLKGHELTLFRPDLKKAQTDTVKMEGDKLILGHKTYTRYKPS